MRTLLPLQYLSLLISIILLLELSPIVIASLDLVCQIINGNGYPCLTYSVITEDGYYLTVHRIPPKNQTLKEDALNVQKQNPAQAFVLMHGIIGSAADFALPGRGKALANILHDEGFDVWLPSARGTTWSKRHRDYDSSSAEFWDFSWHEIGVYDLPAVIDFILEETKNSKIFYVGHSQGSTVCMVMLSQKPEYNDKIAMATFLAPVSFLGHLESPPLRIMASRSDEIEALLKKLNLNEILPSNAMNQLGGHLLCGPTVPLQSLCIMSIYLIVGFSDYELDRSILPKIFETTPAGISAKQLLHFGQLIQSGKFQQFDYGSKQKNYNKYRRKMPAEYNLRNIRVPLHLVYGSKDYIMVKQDVLILAAHLKNTKFAITEVRGFNHIDLLYSTEAHRLIYKKIVANTKNFLATTR